MGISYGFFCLNLSAAMLLNSLIPMSSAMDSAIPFIAGGGYGC